MLLGYIIRDNNGGKTYCPSRFGQIHLTGPIGSSIQCFGPKLVPVSLRPHTWEYVRGFTKDFLIIYYYKPKSDVIIITTFSFLLYIIDL